MLKIYLRVICQKNGHEQMNGIILKILEKICMCCSLSMKAPTRAATTGTIILWPGIMILMEAVLFILNWDIQKSHIQIPCFCSICSVVFYMQWENNLYMMPVSCLINNSIICSLNHLRCKDDNLSGNLQ